MKANSDKSKQSNKATRRVLAGVLCGASVFSLVLSLVMPPISQAIANDAQTVSAEETVMEGSSSESTGVGSTAGDAESQNSDDAENGASEGTVAADSTADGAEVKGAEQPSDAQPSDNENSDENAIAPVSAEGYKEVNGDVAHAFDSGGKYRLSDKSWSDSQITITKNTTIDLAGHMLCHGPGSVGSFIVVQNNATLTIEDSAEVNDATSSVTNNPGQLAKMTWTGDNRGAPQSLTYYETTSTPNTDDLGTTETTTEHVVSGFGAIVAASDSGSVQQVISVADGGTLNLNGGMITTPRTLGNNGHVIFSRGTVNISGGYVANGSGGGWGGGLCMATGSLNMTGGVIAANKAASGGGIFADSGVTLNLSGGVISGNATYVKDIYNGDNTDDGGYGGGVYTKGATVTISGSACITNNRADVRIASDNLYNNGLLGGGGIASTNGGKLTMTGGSVTANYSHEAGGGIYAGFYSKDGSKDITFEMTGGKIAGNIADNAEGGGLRIAGGENGHGTLALISAGENSRIYITHNKTMTGSNEGRKKGDWGGGGVFIQQGGKLNIVKTLITNNEAGGWGGGVGACPTGETIVSYSNGAAIYNNKDNDGKNCSGGGHGKNEDSQEDYIKSPFKDAGHKDFFLVRNKDHANSTIAAVLGKMLGGGSAGWKGTCDRKEITIDPNGGAEAKYMFGLEAHPTDEAKTAAQNAATTVISGNYSFTHGGGIMTNGGLVVGEVSELSVYPNMKLNATKVLNDAMDKSLELEGHEYKFKLLRQVGDKEPSWKDNDKFDAGDCYVAGEATVTPDGKITFDSGKDYSSGQYVFYLVEEPVSGANESDTRFDKTIYKIVATVDSTPYKTVKLMSIPINYYKVNQVTVYKKGEKDIDFKQLNSGYSVDYLNDHTTAVVTIGDSGDNPTFTNKIVPPVSWTPKATKVVEGGEMKEFTLQLAKDSHFRDEDIIGTAVTSGPDKTQTLSFKDKSNETIELKYKLSDIRNNPDDPGGSTGGPSKTFTYYVREKTDGSQFSHYTYDHSVYKIAAKATVQPDKTIKCEVTYREGTVNSNGEWTADANTKDHRFADGSTPTFTNTYSTSLPLSGMSGVTLTYLAGAAVLCAAAVWMHIRRKTNAKGGERRE